MSLHSLYAKADKNISQRSAATRLNCGEIFGIFGIFGNYFIANLLLSILVKEYFEIGQCLIKLRQKLVG